MSEDASRILRGNKLLIDFLSNPDVVFIGYGVGLSMEAVWTGTIDFLLGAASIKMSIELRNCQDGKFRFVEANQLMKEITTVIAEKSCTLPS